MGLIKYTLFFLISFFTFSVHANLILKVVKLKVDNYDRKYLYYVPNIEKNTKPIPLVVVFHGGGGSADQVARKLDFTQLAEEKKFIIMYPDAYLEHWNDLRGDAETDAHKKKINDIKFIELALKDIKQKLSKSEIELDHKRIFATGVSNGGIMLHTLAIKTEFFNKIAPVSANIPLGLQEMTTLSHPDILMINGSDDRVVPFAGGVVARNRGKVNSVLATTSFWLKQNKCIFTLPLKPVEGVKNEGSFLSRCDKLEEEWSCTDNKKVKLMILYKGGHTWPGKNGHFQVIAGEPCLNYKGEELVLKFFGL